LKKAVEGYRTPGRFRERKTFQVARERLGLRQPSGAFPSRVAKVGVSKTALKRQATVNQLERLRLQHWLLSQALRLIQTTTPIPLQIHRHMRLADFFQSLSHFHPRITQINA
jgi:hypothetical protein